MNIKSLCIIPARGGSVRIPRKNIRDFLGKPIISYSIEAAVQSRLFSTIMVSTEDLEIAEIAQKYGAEVPFLRSLQNSNGNATTIEVISEVIDQYKQRGIEYSHVCCLYPAAPLVSAEILQSGFNLVNEGVCNFVFPILKFGHPIWRGLKVDKEKLAECLFPDLINSRTQDLEEVYHDAGQWYWFKQPFEFSDNILSNRSKVILLSSLRAQDIDNEEDWKLAEIKYLEWKRIIDG